MHLHQAGRMERGKRRKRALTGFEYLGLSDELAHGVALLGLALVAHRHDRNAMNGRDGEGGKDVHEARLDTEDRGLVQATVVFRGKLDFDRSCLLRYGGGKKK